MTAPSNTQLGLEEVQAEEAAIREGSRLVADAGALVAGRLGVAAVGWIGTLLIVRSLSVDEFGRFSFIFGFLGLVATVTELGIGRLAVAGIVTRGDDAGAFAGTYVLLRGALGLAGYAVAVVVVMAAGYPADVVRATAVAGLVLVIATPSHAYVAVFQAHGRLRPVALGSFLGQLGQFALTAALAADGGSVLLFTIPAVICELVILAWHRRCARRLLELRYRVMWSTWGSLVREAIPLAIGGVLATAYYRIDSVMLSKLDTFSAVGIYGVAYKFVDVVHFVPSALMLATLPVLVRSWPHHPLQFGAAFRRAFMLLALGACLIVVEFVLFAEPVIDALYGDDYLAAAGPTLFVVGGECVAFFGALAFTTLVASGRHRLYPFVTLLGLALNVGLNLWLIPIRSFHGAAAATLVTEIVVVALLWLALLRHRDLRPSNLGAAWWILITGLVAAAFGAGLRQVLPWPAAAAGTGVAFLACAEVLLATAGRGGLRSLVHGEGRVAA